jgi:hypothetical protein
MAQDRGRWRALVNSILNLRVPLTAGKLSSVQRTGISRGVLSSMELVSTNVYHWVEPENTEVMQLRVSCLFLIPEALCSNLKSDTGYCD